MFGSDGGSDQIGAQRVIKNELSPFLLIWHFHHWCLLHLLHLIVGRQLCAAPGYFGNVASIVNVYRTSDHATQIVNVAEAMNIAAAQAGPLLLGGYPGK